MKRKRKLAFQELAKGLTLLNFNNSSIILGGSSSGDLTPEQLWFLQNPLKGYAALYNSEYASSIGQKFEGVHNGYGDALRHSLFTALNTVAFGKEGALELGIAHELSAPILEKEYAMDIHNNQWGANWANNKSSLNITQFISDFNEAVSKNQIIIIDTPNGIPSPSSGIQDFTYNGRPSGDSNPSGFSGFPTSSGY